MYRLDTTRPGNVNKENFIAKTQIKYFQSGHFSWVGWLRASKHIFNLGPIVYRTTYPWYIELPIYGISNPLPVVFWPPHPWYIEPLYYGIMNPLLIKLRGFNLPWWGSKYYDGNMTPRSKYHMVYWTRGRFFRGS